MPIDRQVDKDDVVYIHTGILLSHKKNEIKLFAVTWMDLEIIILSKLDRERQILYAIICTWNLKQ